MTKRLSGRQRQERNRRILAASDVCWLCGQPGADAVDHVTALARGGTETGDNLRPAHHDVEPRCNRRKGAKDASNVDIIRNSRDW
jgi:5-methylcytosine-specific restriction endonuclease McrA